MQIAEAIAPETAALVELLAATPVGEVASYTAMSSAIGRDIAARRYLIPSAIRHAAIQHGAIFGTVRGVGYKRLASTEAYILGAHARRRIRRSAKRASDAIVEAMSKANDMPDAEKRRAYAEVNALALVRHIASDKEVTATVAEPKAEPVAIVARRVAQAMGLVS